MSYSLDTYITIGFPGSVEHEIKLELVYEVTPERSATLTQPGEGASVNITDAHVVETSGRRYDAPDWLWAMIEGNDELQTEMLRDAWEHDEANRDARAEYEYEKRLERNQ